MYTIKLLDNASFNQLPYKDADKSLGLADYKNKRAYVRESGIPALDLLVAGHEIQELLATVSPHEEDGIRYKKSGGMMQTILSIAAPIAIGLLTGGTGFALAPWFGSTATGALLSGLGSAGVSAAYGGGARDMLTQGALGAFGGGGSTLAGAGARAGWQAAGQAGAGTLGQLGAAGQGALLGSYGGQSLIGAPGTASAGRSVGLFGPGTMLGGAFSGGTSKALATGLAANTAASMLRQNTSDTYQGRNITDDSFIPSGYTSFNNTLNYTPNIQGIKPTPTSGGFSSATQKTGMYGAGNLGGFDQVIPGRNRQNNVYTWQ